MTHTHPFDPQISENTRILLVGTLPPETATWYFSNSDNTRLWDILKSISLDNPSISHYSNNLSQLEKKKILNSLEIGIYDIIKEYDREKDKSTKDTDIIPQKYSDIANLIIDSKVNKLLFVYKNAAKWFLHSLTGEPPIKVNRLKTKVEYGEFYKLKLKNKDISCVLLPSPLNRGKKGETLTFKLENYRKEIKN
jgi:G:T/U-mismatch repair DNA glycosylase